MKCLVILVTACFALISTQVSVAGASDDCDYSWVLVNEYGTKATAEDYAKKDRHEAECKQAKAEKIRKGNEARSRLQSEFGIDTSGMSDDDAMKRLYAEVDKKENAEKAAADAKAEAADKQRQNSIDAAMKKQDKMLKDMGVNMGTMNADASDDSDPPDAVELQMYQKMVDSGVAPQCKGKNGWALIDCVDEATVED